MYLFGNSLSHCFCSLPQLQIRLCIYPFVLSYPPHFHKIPPFSYRSISSSPRIGDSVEPQSETKQPESQFQNFKKFAGTLQKTGNSEGETRKKDLEFELKLLVEEIRGLKGKSKSKVEDGKNEENLEKAKQYKSLNSVFADQPVVKVTKSKVVKSGNSESETKNKDRQLKLKQLVEEIIGLKAKPNVKDRENKENLKKAKQYNSLSSVFRDQPVVKVTKSEVVKSGNSESETRNEDQQFELDQSMEEIRGLKAKPKVKDGENKENLEKAKQHKSLSSVFTKSKEVENGEQMVISKVLSPDMETFLYHLYQQGHFDDANFVKGRFDLSLFEHAGRREYIKYVAERFGRDNHGLAKFLLGSDLKLVVMLGCPNVSRRCVSPAKGLRWFFGIPEHTVCDQCTLRKKCKFVDVSAGKSDLNINMEKTLKLITYYALESVHPQLVIPREVKEAVSRLLKEIMKWT